MIRPLKVSVFWVVAPAVVWYKFTDVSVIHLQTRRRENLKSHDTCFMRGKPNINQDNTTVLYVTVLIVAVYMACVIVLRIS
jgi:hypothetical protein